jgi:hypothetical protein
MAPLGRRAKVLRRVLAVVVAEEGERARAVERVAQRGALLRVAYIADYCQRSMTLDGTGRARRGG